MENNMNQNNQTAPEGQQEKTFTQEQLNAIVGKRLSEQKQQQEADLAKKADELNKREMAIRAKELLSEKRLPKELAEVLRYDNEDELVKAINILDSARAQHSVDNSEYKRMDSGRLPKGEHAEPDTLASAFGLKGR